MSEEFPFRITVESGGKVTGMRAAQRGFKSAREGIPHTIWEGRDGTLCLSEQAPSASLSVSGMDFL